MTVLTPNQVAWAAQQAGFTGSDVPLFTAIAGGESDYDTTARGHYVERGVTHYVYGLWQISDVHTDLMNRYNWADPVQNAQMAKAIRESQGLGAWEAYTNGRYLSYLPGAIQGASNPQALTGSTGPAPGGGGTTQQAGFLDSVSGLGNFLDKLTDPWFWVRVGEILGGGILLVVGVMWIMRNKGETHSLSEGLKNFGGGGKFDWVGNVVKKP